MQYPIRWFLVLVLATSSTVCLRATTTTIVVTGDSATGVTGGLFETVAPAALGNSGKIVFRAELQTGAGGVLPGDANGVWSYDQGSLSLIARQGVGNVPGVASANFDLFRSIAIGDNGDVFVRGSLESGVGGVDSTNREGIWKYAGGNSVVVRTGDTPVPGVPGAVFDLLPSIVQVSGTGQIAIDASMAAGGGVTSLTDGGVWTFDALGGTLWTREGTTNAPGFSSIFNNFISPRVNDDQQIAFRATLEINGGINMSNDLAIWKYSPLGGTVIAREGSDAVPGIASADFDVFSDPLLNGNDQLAFYSTLVHGGSINSANDEGVWLYTGTTGALRHW